MYNASKKHPRNKYAKNLSYALCKINIAVTSTLADFSGGSSYEIITVQIFIEKFSKIKNKTWRG